MMIDERKTAAHELAVKIHGLIMEEADAGRVEGEAVFSALVDLLGTFISACSTKDPRIIAREAAAMLVEGVDAMTPKTSTRN